MSNKIIKALAMEIMKKPIKPPVTNPVMPPLLSIRKDEYAIVRLSDNAHMCTLLLGPNGAGSSPYQVQTQRNPQLALELNNILEQEAKGRVSLGMYQSV